MFMSNLDFLSSPPQMYFLKKKTNKTLFGGILFVIYIIIMLAITIIYLLNFFLNDKYDIRYSLYKNFTENSEEYNKKEDLNPHLNFSINIMKISQELEPLDLSNQFTIYDENGTIINKNEIISRTPTDMNFFISYFCLFNCSWEGNEDINDTSIVYSLRINYSGYKFNHQDDDIPLERNNDKYIFYKDFLFSFNKTTLLYINWEVIKYKEERGIFGLFDNFLNKKNEFSSIDIDNVEQGTTERIIGFEHFEIPSLKYRVLAFIRMNNKHNQYIEYIRTKKSILDVFANIGALFSTLFSVFSFIFKFFSKNFDNYTIIKEILSYSRLFKKINLNKKIFKSNSLKFDCVTSKKQNYENQDIISIDNNNKTMPINSIGVKIEEKEGNQTKRTDNLIKINFIYFILEIFYCKRKNMRKEFKIIDICNKLLSKYASIDIILHNQIIFEILMEDYQLDSEDLDINTNNSLLKKLNSIIT